MSIKYVDYKFTRWGRIHFKDDADIDKIITALKEGVLPDELCDEKEYGFDEFEDLYDTEEFISPSENNNECTIEVYQEDINEPTKYQKEIWNNKNNNYD